GVSAWLGQVFQLSNDGGGRLVDAALQVHRVHAGSDGLQAFVDDGLSQNGSGGGAVTGCIVGLGRYVLDQLGAHVFEGVFQFDFLGNRNTVFGDGRGTEGFGQNHVTAFRAEGGFDGVGQYVDANEHFLAGGIAKLDFFSSHFDQSSNF